MKRQFVWTLVMTLTAAGGFVGSDACFAQRDEEFDVLIAAPPAPPRPEKVKLVERSIAADPWALRAEAAVQIDPHQPTPAIEQAAAKVRDADGEEAKRDARRELAELLDKYFEEDMQRRDEELKRIEERVKKLHALMSKRAAKKKEIIELQMKVLENQADGLGFFSNGIAPDRYGGPYGRGYGGTFIQPRVNFAPHPASEPEPAQPPRKPPEPPSADRAPFFER